jgi:hypothetical protein
MSNRRIRPPRRQRGLALLVLLTLFAMAAAYMLVSSLNRSATALTLARSNSNQAAMQQAKAALIAWSASEALQTQSGGTFQPGALPCPDRNNDGAAEPTCTNANLLGRLPYKTLGIAPLYDASGEVLWYGVSTGFKRLSTNVINSDTLGALTITGLMPASNVIAVVLAPGKRVGTQDRSFTGASCSNAGDPCNTTSNYLEGVNGNTTPPISYITAIENLTDPVAANQFNDQLLAITQQDLMSVVEPVVAARIQRDIIAQYLYNSDATLTDSGNVWSDNAANRDKSRYFDAWAGFPFAAPFASPGASTFTGTAGTLEGLLPVVGSLSYNWTLGSGGAVKTGGSGNISSVNCAATTAANLKCSITSSGFFSQPSFRMSGTVAGVGFSLVQLPQLSDVSTSGGSISSRSLSGSLNAAGAGIVMLDATMPWSFFGTTVAVTINNGSLVTSPVISPADGIAGWFTSNQWHKQTYYAVSPGYAPGGAGSCTAGGTCLTVNNLTTTPTNDKQAILILAGRSLAGTARPNATLSDYLEGQNASTGDRTFEHGLGTITSTGGAINDKVVVVAP